jgi:holo-[acyl-carrier protein] synthase
MLGIDIVQIDRIEKMIDKFGQKALKRFLTEKEIKIIKTSQSAAGYWAAKEAFSKAIGTGIGKKCSFSDIEILKNENGKPYFSSKTLERFNIKNADLSISHDGNFAIAAVIIIK